MTLGRNVLAAVAQVIVNAVAMFVTYRTLALSAGVELLGVWSLILATTSVSQIASAGLAGGVVRFVAQAMGRGDRARAGACVETAALSIALIAAVIALALLPGFRWALNLLISERLIELATGLVPYAVASLWVGSVGAVFNSSLDGCQRVDLRATALVVASLVQVVLAVILIPRFGLQGVAFAQLMQALVVLFLSWLLLRRTVGGLPLLPYRWRRDVFGEMFAYGAKLQAISVLSLLFDPLTKALLARYAGVEPLGYYEMANKVILQVRGLIVEGARVLVPRVSSLGARESREVNEIFTISYEVVFFLAVVLCGCIALLFRSVSLVWLGHVQETLALYGTVLVVGWMMNTIAVPAYFVNQGTGVLRPNLVGQLLICSSVPLFGSGFALALGPVGAVAGVVSALVIGSVYGLWHFVSRNRPVGWRLLPPGMAPITVVVCGGMALLLGPGRQQPLWIEWGLAAVVVVLGWIHPLGRQIRQRVGL